MHNYYHGSPLVFFNSTFRVEKGAGNSSQSYLLTSTKQCKVPEVSGKKVTSSAAWKRESFLKRISELSLERQKEKGKGTPGRGPSLCKDARV
jgi:hypothetical protein